MSCALCYIRLVPFVNGWDGHICLMPVLCPLTGYYMSLLIQSKCLRLYCRFEIAQIHSSCQWKGSNMSRGWVACLFSRAITAQNDPEKQVESTSNAYIASIIGIDTLKFNCCTLWASSLSCTQLNNDAPICAYETTTANLMLGPIRIE